MGNRAFIYPEKSTGKRKLGVYLHWNGGPTSVIPLIKFCKARKFRPLSDGYGVARLCQVMGNFLGGSLSLGVEYVEPDCIDTNHVPYCITDDWEIKNIDDYKTDYEGIPSKKDMVEFLTELNKCQPKSERVPLDFIFEDKPSLKKIKKGDKVTWFDDIYSQYKTATVAGINDAGVPAIDRYSNWKTNRNCALDILDFRLKK